MRTHSHTSVHTSVRLYHAAACITACRQDARESTGYTARQRATGHVRTKSASIASAGTWASAAAGCSRRLRCDAGAAHRPLIRQERRAHRRVAGALLMQGREMSSDGSCGGPRSACLAACVRTRAQRRRARRTANALSLMLCAHLLSMGARKSQQLGRMVA